MTEYFERDGEPWGKDEHGEFRVNAGSTSYTEGRCNATLKFTMERYGEVRYCTGYPRSHFSKDGSGSDRCKHHQAHDELMKYNKENFETGAFVESFDNFFSYLDAHERIMAIALFKDLLGESHYDFDLTESTIELDMDDAEWYEDDDLELSFPVAQRHIYPAKALWFAALQFIKAENIDLKIWKDAYNTQYAAGERRKIAGSGMEGPYYDTDEHHLNLTLNRLFTNQASLLKQGGVVDHSDSEVADTRVQNWVFSVSDVHPTKEADPFTQTHEEQ